MKVEREYQQQIKEKYRGIKENNTPRKHDKEYPIERKKRHYNEKSL
jgi:hypothetical protein